MIIKVYLHIWISSAAAIKTCRRHT